MSTEILTPDELRDDRRNPTPSGDNRRTLYDKMRAIHLEPAVDDLVEGKARSLAEEYAMALEGMNPYIALRSQLEFGDWDVNSPHLRVGAFRLIYPTLKSLNDIYLGDAIADVYLERLSKLIHTSFGGQDGCVIFSTKGKSGHFIFDLQKYAESRGMAPETALASFAITLKHIQEHATLILKDVLGVKFAELVGRLKRVDEDIDEVRKLRTLPLKELLEQSEEGDRLKKRLHDTAQLTNSLPESDAPTTALTAVVSAEEAPTDAFIDTLRDELSALDDPDTSNGVVDGDDIAGHHIVPIAVDGHSVHIGFGLARPSVISGPIDVDDPAWNRSLLNSDRAARTTGLRTFARPGSGLDGSSSGSETDRRYERLLVQIHNYIHTIMDLLRARLQLEKDLSAMGPFRWWDFFGRDEQGRYRMREEMIIQYRKETARGVYTGFLGDDVEMRAIFERYYNWVNTLDGFNDVDYERVGKIVALVHKLRTTEDLEELKPLLSEAREELSVSMKDRGDKITRTIRSEVGVLLSGKHTATIIGDHVGFGGLNQASYEKSMFEVFDALGIDLQELVAMGDAGFARENLLRVATECVDSIMTDDGVRERFFEAMDGIGQVGTAHIRNAEEELANYAHAMGAEDVVVVPGGDEVRVVMTGNIDSDRVHRELFDVAMHLNMRLFAMVRDLDEEGERAREVGLDPALAEHMNVMAQAEECFLRKKDQGVKGPTAHVLTLDPSGGDDHEVKSIRAKAPRLS